MGMDVWYELLIEELGDDVTMHRCAVDRDRERTGLGEAESASRYDAAPECSPVDRIERTRPGTR